MKFRFFSLALLLSFIFDTFPCTTFLLKTENEMVFGKNYDFTIGYGIVFVNKRGVEKTAFTKTSPASWISKYGSVTFNQFGRELPSGGINESGLVIELMWLDETVFPDPDERKSVGGILQWIQYQMDNSSSIEDVISSDKVIRIPKDDVPVHFLVADKTGNCVSIEFLNGRLVYHSGEAMPVKVLTNNTYESSVEYVKKFEGFGGNENLLQDKSSLNRFAGACSMVRNYSASSGKNPVEYGFDILKSVDQGEYTRWSIIYDINNLIVYFRTDKNQKIRNLDLKLLDFKCVSKVKMININSDNEGNINSFLTDYDFDANRSLIFDSFSGVDFLKDVAKESLESLAKYPDELKCSDKSTWDPMNSNNRTVPGLPLGIAACFLVISLIVLLKFRSKRRSWKN